MYNTKRIKSFRQGQTVYGVTALGEKSYITKYRIDGKFKINYGEFHNYAHIPASVFHHGKFYERSISVMDFNIVPNNYNNHRVFTSRKKAESYLKLCLQGTVEGFVKNDQLLDLLDEVFKQEYYFDYDQDYYDQYIPETIYDEDPDYVTNERV